MLQAIISDLHFGAKQSSEAFLKMQCNWFENEFKPFIKDHDVKVINVLGDVFDTRSSVNVKIQNYVYDIFYDLSKSFEINVIAGNHDLYLNNSNDYTSLVFLRGLKNIRLIRESPQVIGDILFVPWVNNIPEFLEYVKNIKDKPSVCMGHFDLLGFQMYKNSMASEAGIPPGYLSENFKRIYSGHFHTPSRKEYPNGSIVTYIGSPFQITRNDCDDVRGFRIVDFENGVDEYIESKQIAKFIKVFFPDMPEASFVKNNIVDVLVDYGKKFSTTEISKYISEISKLEPFSPPEIKIVNKPSVDLKQDLSNTEIKSVEALLNQFMDEVDEQFFVKQELSRNEIKNLMVELYKKSGGDE